jgi:hypothetical protein
VSRSFQMSRTSLPCRSHRVIRSAGLSVSPTSRTRARSTPGTVSASARTASAIAPEETVSPVPREWSSTRSGLDSGRNERSAHNSPSSTSSRPANDREDERQRAVRAQQVDRDRVDQGPACPGGPEHAGADQQHHDAARQCHQGQQGGEGAVRAR